MGYYERMCMIRDNMIKNNLMLDLILKRLIENDDTIYKFLNETAYIDDDDDDEYDDDEYDEYDLIRKWFLYYSFKRFL
jgi:hypothetical protein